MLIKSFIFILSIGAFSAHGQELVASGPGVHFKLNFEYHKISYKGHESSTNFLHKKCSRLFLQSFRKNLLTSIRDPKSLVHDSKLTLRLDKNLWHVNPKSHLGLLLIGMDDEIIRMKLMEKSLCRK